MPHKYSEEKSKQLLNRFSLEYFKKNLVLCNELCELLQSTGAVIAGGSILKLLKYDIIKGRLNNYENAQPANLNIIKQTFDITDLDIYINVKDYSKFVDLFTKSHKFDIKRENTGSVYDMSFFKKNGIQKRLNLKKIYREETITIDLMKIGNARSVIDVVSNFDLTFCECWFNGKDFFSNYPEDIENNKGELKQDYLQAYFQGNTFLIYRINKYIKKGFSISIPKQEVLVLNPIINQRELIVKNDEKTDEWFIYRIFNTIREYKLNNTLNYDDNKIDMDKYKTVQSVITLGKSFGEEKWKEIIDILNDDGIIKKYVWYTKVFDKYFP